MSTVSFEYKPLPVFVPFHASKANDRLVVGGYGSGKSNAGCAEMIAWGLEEPGAEFLITRKTVPALRDTTEKIFTSMLPPDFFDQCEKKKAGNHWEHITFPNGTTYYFRGMDDWKKHRSMNLTGIFWDEADEFSRDDFEGMQSRIRQMHRVNRGQHGRSDKITHQGNVLAANPWGHNWFWEDFVNESTRRRSTEFWTSTSFDNPFLGRAYLERLLAMPDPWVRRFVLCSFDEFAGSIYPEWSWDTHVIEPYKDSAGRYAYDPSSWFKMGYDPGTGTVNMLTGEAKGSLNAALWVYYDKKDHRLVGVAEYAEGGLNVAAHAKAWRKIEAQHGMSVQQRIADPKAVNHRDRGSNRRLSDLYARQGYNFSLGPGGIDDRVWGLGELIANGRFVVTNECVRIYEQLLNYRYEDLTPAQMDRGTTAKPLKKDVDLVDAAQYAVSRYVPPAKVEKPPPDPETQHDLEIHALIRKQVQERARKNAQSSSDLGMLC